MKKLTDVRANTQNFAGLSSAVRQMACLSGGPAKVASNGLLLSKTGSTAQNFVRLDGNLSLLPNFDK
jgi:hypothetical protein